MRVLASSLHGAAVLMTMSCVQQHLSLGDSGKLTQLTSMHVRIISVLGRAFKFLCDRHLVLLTSPTGNYLCSLIKIVTGLEPQYTSLWTWTHNFPPTHSVEANPKYSRDVIAVLGLEDSRPVATPSVRSTQTCNA